MLVLMLLGSSARAQSRYTISGYVQDAETGEKLIGATIAVPQLRVGTIANAYGFFSITLPAADSVRLVVSFVGYQANIRKVRLREDQMITIGLKPESDTREVQIVADRMEDLVESTRMSTIDVPIEQLRKVPAILGENDILKAIQLLPGVKGGAEGTAGIYVRGGGPDQNLILLDGAPVYNVSHLFGFFSVFNSDAIQHVELTKGGFPAHYGGRLSSVLDISLKEGNMRNWQGDGGIGIVASRLTVQGPLIKDKMSLLLSGRRTYVDALAQPIIQQLNKEAPGNTKGTGGYFFYDLNAKLNYIASAKDRFFLSAYSGLDKAYLKVREEYARADDVVEYQAQNSNLHWGNLTTSFRWNHVFSPKLFANTMLTYSQYAFNVGISMEEVNYSYDDPPIRERSYQGGKYRSGIQDQSIRTDFDYLPNPQHAIKFGAGFIAHTYHPGAAQIKIEDFGSANQDTTFAPPVKTYYGKELSAYVEDDWTITPQLKANLGLHVSGFAVQGGFFPSVQPRLAMRYRVGEWALKTSWVSMRQYIHLLTNSGVGLPTDLWLPATKSVPPQSSWQAAIGVSRHIRDLELSVEGYYKPMKNLIEYKEGANFLADPAQDWQTKVEMGNGVAYGLEVLLQKKVGRTSGWIGYTLSWSNRTFPNLNNGETYPYHYDRRHDVAIVISHKISEKVDVAANWVYGSGNAITLAKASFYGYADLMGIGSDYYLDDQTSRPIYTYYGKRNSYRMSPSHRLDVAINVHRTKNSRFFGTRERVWSFGAYNAYNNKNPFFMYLGEERIPQQNGTYSQRRVFKQVSLIPIIPSVTYNFHF